MGRSTLGTTTHSFRTGSASTSSIHPSSLSTNDFSIMNPSNAVTPQMNDHLRGGYPTTTQTGNLFEQSMRLQQQARSSTTTLQTAQNPSSFSSLNNNDRLGIVSAGASVMTNHNHTAAIVPEGPFGTPTAAGAANAGFGQSNVSTLLYFTSFIIERGAKNSWRQLTWFLFCFAFVFFLGYPFSPLLLWEEAMKSLLLLLRLIR